MAEVSLLVMLVIVVVSAIVIFKIVKGLIQTIAVTGAAVAIAVAVAGGFVVNDLFDLRENLQTRDNLLLISNSEGTELIGGVVVKGKSARAAGAVTDPEEAFEILAANDLARLNAYFSGEDYARLLGSNYKLIIFKEDLLTNLTTAPGTVNAPNAVKTPSLLGFLGFKIVQDPLFLAAEYKKGNAIVYPETAVFKAVKLIPLSLFKNAAAKVLQKAADAGEDVATKAVAAVSTAAAGT